MQPYNEQFFASNSEWARSAAREIVPLVVELIQPHSVIDVGCGTGTWLSVFHEHDVVDVWGVDGEYVQRELLEIPAKRFLPRDLTKPLCLDRQFDLVVSLEVAEHLPPECAADFVMSLTRLGPVVLFSAAIPGQGGVQHINEQWPDYWAKLFAAAGYVPVDWLRKRIWQNARVAWYYAQNTLTFTHPEYLASHPQLKYEWEQTAPAQLSIVHPLQYQTTLAWVERVYQITLELGALIPAEERFILVDEAQLEGLVTAGRRYVPFLETDGYYAGPPQDDVAALAELNRLRAGGASFIVFAWPAFWWLEHYTGLHEYLRKEFRCALENERMVVFDLRP